MAEPSIFSVANHHVGSCGNPPHVDDSSRPEVKFRSYFENALGEQWIFLYSEPIDRISIYSGDCGWEHELTVKSLKDSLSDLPGECADKLLEAANTKGALQVAVVCGKQGPTILGDEEQLWVNACMSVVECHRRSRKC